MNAATDHRDAARVLREQARLWSLKQNRPRQRFYSQHAAWHEVQATKLDQDDILEEQMYDLELLLTKEVIFGGGKAGYILTDNQYVSTLIVEHHILGPLQFTIPTERIPSWLMVWTEPIQESTNSYDKIHSYLV